MDRKASRRTSVTEVVGVSKLLEEHFDREMSRYRDDWSDEKIARAVSADLPGKNVMFVRNQLGMRINTSKAVSSKTADLENRVVILEQTVLKLMDDMEIGVLLTQAIGRRAMGADNYGRALTNARQTVKDRKSKGG